MEIILAYLAFAALLASIAGLFTPQKLVFWCAPDDRSRAMAFTAYLATAIVLAVTFILVVPEPQPKPVVIPKVEDPPVKIVPQKPAPHFTKQTFLKEVIAHLETTPHFTASEVTVQVIDFNKPNAAIELKFHEKPYYVFAMEHGIDTVQGMVKSLKAHGWEIKEPDMIYCQVQALEIKNEGEEPELRSIGIARYEPKTKQTTWLRYQE